jgi:hypothetical protein
MMTTEQYNRALEICTVDYADYVTLGFIKNQFVEQFPNGDNLTREAFIEFFSQFTDDMSEIDYIELNYEWVMSGDDSVFDDAEY